MILTFRPIKVWPAGWLDRSDQWRAHSPFSAKYEQTLTLLDRELDHLQARAATLQVDATERDCRIDGQLRADAKVAHPGVILTIDTRAHGSLVYATDAYVARYGNKSWQENLRAVALGLEALRKVERYGIAERGQQYAGYRELGTGIALGPGELSVDQAARILIDSLGLVGQNPPNIIGDAVKIRLVYADAVKQHHPDAGGDAAVFRLITTARDVLLADAT